MRKSLSFVAAVAVTASSLLGTMSAFAASNATLNVTAPTSIELGKPQDILIKLNPGDGNKVDSIVLAGTYSPDVADITFAVATGSIAQSFSLTKPVLDTKTGIFSVTCSSLQDTISTASDIVRVTVTPKKAGKFAFALTQGGEQGTQVILTNSATNILDKSAGVTPVSTDITVVGDNSTVSNGVVAPVVTEMAPATDTGVITETGTTSSGAIDTTTTNTAPKSWPGQVFAGLALLLALAGAIGFRKARA